MAETGAPSPESIIPDPDLEQIATAVCRRAGARPFDLAIFLGSGLGSLAGEVEEGVSFNYAHLPFFPAAAVEGHAGELVAGILHGCRVLLFAGRFHLYEGYSARQVTVPVRLAHRLGCRRLLLTNAAGGINGQYAPGDFMYIADHLNLLGDNPLRALRAHPFLDLSHLYRIDLYPALQPLAARAQISLHLGVLAAMPGPSYETPAEVRMLRLLGADAVSMSTIPEAIMGKYLGMEVAGLSFIANRAAGLGAPLSHAEVLAAARSGAGHFSTLVGSLMRIWTGEPRQLSVSETKQL